MTGHQMKLMRKHIILELRFFISNITKGEVSIIYACPHSGWSKWTGHLIIFSLELVSLSCLHLKKVYAKYFRNCYEIFIMLRNYMLQLVRSGKTYCYCTRTQIHHVTVTYCNIIIILKQSNRPNVLKVYWCDK